MQLTTTELKHGAVRVCTEGPEDGPVVLWIHGATYPLEVFSLLTPAFVAQGYRCIRYDLYGRGHSGWDSTGLTTGLLAEQACEVLAHFRITSAVHIVSLSNSDLVANCIAALHPERVSSITWIAPTGRDSRTMNLWFRFANLVPGMDRLLALLMRPRLIDRMKQHRSHLSPQQSTSAGPIYELAIHSLSTHKSAVRAATNSMLKLPSQKAMLADLQAVATARTAVLMITFGEEQDAQEDDLAVLRQHLEVTELKVSTGSHMGLLEDPDRILPHMLRFTGHKS